MREAETDSVPVPERQVLGMKHAGDLIPTIIGFRCRVSGFSPAAGKKMVDLIEKEIEFPLWGIVDHENHEITRK